MGKYFVRSGYVIPSNIQTGTASVTTDTNGDGTSEITFSDTFKSTPKIVGTVQGTDITGTVSIRSKDEIKFQVGIDGSSLTGQAVSIDWVAIDTVKPNTVN